MRTLAVPLPQMRRSVGASVSTCRSGRSVPARSGAMAPLARGAVFTATPRSPRSCLRGVRIVLGWGGKEPPGGCHRPSLRRLRVPSGRAAVGCRWRGLRRTARGPHRGTSMLGRSRRSLGAQRSRLWRESTRRAAAHPPGKEEPGTACHKRPTRGIGKTKCYHPAMSRQIFGMPAGGEHRPASDAVACPVPCNVGPVEVAAP
jgi:hypothetical protein